MRASVLMCLALLPLVANAAPASTSAPIVFLDVSGPDLAKLATFYKDVFNWNIGAGQFEIEKSLRVPVVSPLPGSLLQQTAHGDEPAHETMIFLGVEDVTATLAKVVANGGAVVRPRAVVPGVVILAIFADPAGNRLGLVEMQNGKAKIPPPRPAK
jgi:predicted enzyme related to lactoylglutathione lyase